VADSRLSHCNITVQWSDSGQKAANDKNRPEADVFSYLAKMNIGLLADHTEAIATLAEWYLSEWEPYYGVHGPGDAWADLTSRCNREKIPIGLVAIEGDRVYGTIALDLDVTTNLTPSVVGLLVLKQARITCLANQTTFVPDSAALRLPPSSFLAL